MRSLVLFGVFLYLIGGIQATPITNATTSTITACNSEALPTSFTDRTIWSIIFSSVLTLFACIYSAIHPNIPSPRDNSFCILRRRLGIMIMALIAPELIVTWAMRQWISARQVTRQFEKSGYFNVNPDFFVLMGGFMLYVDGKPYHTLQPDEVLKLIRAGYIDTPTLTENQIQDKSKGTVISKGLIILQVVWFVMQLITRAIYHLETTQLEVGTLAFAVLNLLTYTVWWNKPLDVRCPYPVYWKSTESRPEDHIYEYVSTSTIVPLLIASALVSCNGHACSIWIFSPVLGPIEEVTGLSDIPASRKLRVPTFDGSVISKIQIGEFFSLLHCLWQPYLVASIVWLGFCLSFSQEQVLWRISAVAITFTPWFFFYKTHT
ncbi:hypothetical protein BDR07DRAFT_1290685 [Suillus spraguei]|nr:hypothetical protein BDR07DRAFT_1290685 [Suillus spraguei]